MPLEQRPITGRAAPEQPFRASNQQPGQKGPAKTREAQRQSFDPVKFRAMQIKAQTTPRGFRNTGKLNYRQELFLREYCGDPARNANQAAIRAGYAPSTASMVSWDTLKHPVIQARIQEYDRKVYNRLEISRDRILQHVANIAFYNPLDYFQFDEEGNAEVNLSMLKDQQGIPIQEVKIETDEKGRQKVTLRFCDKLSALTLLGKNQKVFEETPTNQFFSIGFIDKLLAGKSSVGDLTQGDIDNNMLQIMQGQRPPKTLADPTTFDAEPNK